MTTDFRALCAKLTDVLDGLFEDPEIPGEIRRSHSLEEYLTRARAALADEPAVPKGREPASVVSEPTYDDLSELCSQHGLDVDSWPLEKFDALWETARAVLARWGTPNFAETRSSLGDAPQPVPVSERLPGDQLCWWYEPDEDDDGSGYGGKWTLRRIRGCVFCYTHWLPAHALPIPTAND